MAFFRKKPVVIEAIRYHYPDGGNLKSWLGAAFGAESNGELIIHTLEDGTEGQAKHVATDGDWIIKGVAGEYYPCKPSIFEQTYEPLKGLKK